MTKRKHLGVRLLSLCLLALIILPLGAGSAEATSVSMEFSSQYDGDQESELPGREISVDGQLTFQEENAVNPRITISSSDQTVIDQETISVFVEGEAPVETSVDLTGDGAVVTTNGPIPEGTTVSIGFLLYPRGTGDVNVTSATVRADFESPGGVSGSDSTDITTTLEGGPQDRIEDLEAQMQEGGDDEPITILGIPLIWIGGAIGAVVAILVILALVDVATGDK
jgi:hypothetical protein